MKKKNNPQDDPFVDLVAEDVKGHASDEVRAMLRQPENLLRWREALKILLELTETHFTQLQIDIDRTPRAPAGSSEAIEQEAIFRRRRAGIQSFKRKVEGRLREVKIMAPELTNDKNEAVMSERNHARDLVVELLDMFSDLDGIEAEIPEILLPELAHAMTRLRAKRPDLNSPKLEAVQAVEEAKQEIMQDA